MAIQKKIIFSVTANGRAFSMKIDIRKRYIVLSNLYYSYDLLRIHLRVLRSIENIIRLDCSAEGGYENKINS